MHIALCLLLLGDLDSNWGFKGGCIHRTVDPKMLEYREDAGEQRDVPYCSLFGNRDPLFDAAEI